MNEQPELADTADANEHLRREVHAEIGRLLLLYQHLELMLKALLPQLQASEQAARAGADKDIDNLLDSKATMDLLVARLQDSMEIAEPEQFSAYLARITAQRKELVHQFTMLDFGGLDTTEKCRDAIIYLRAQHEFALPLRGVLLAFVRTVMKQPAQE